MNINHFLDDMKFDTRLVEQNIQKGIVKKEDYEAYLKTLSDVANNSETLQLEDASADEPVTASVEADTSAVNPVY